MPKKPSTADKPISRKQKPKQTKAIERVSVRVAAKPDGEPPTIRLAATEATHKAVSTPLLSHTVGRLAAVMRSRGADLPTKSEMDFGMQALAGLAPESTAEVLLCTQMVAVHEVAMGMLTAAKLADTLPQLQEKGMLATRLLGIFERQFQALSKARRPQQVVEVQHTHRHVHIEGQPAPGQPGVVTQIEGQAYGPNDPRTIALAAGPALLGQDTPRDAMPIPADQARSMPAARRRVRDRRPKR